MTDRNKIAKKLAHIETYVQELRDLAHPGEIQEDVRERRFVEHTLQIAVQAMLDVAAEILSSESGGKPGVDRGLIDFLEKNGWVQADLAAQLREWVKLRNLLVYDYDDVDLDLLERIATDHLDGFLHFVQAIRQQLMPS
jgi:uncharacterized protein YutE (UPF0331/DUF86 family)